MGGTGGVGADGRSQPRDQRKRDHEHTGCGGCNGGQGLCARGEKGARVALGRIAVGAAEVPELPNRGWFCPLRNSEGGTFTITPHLRHRPSLPACASATLNCLPQPVQFTLIMCLIPRSASICRRDDVRRLRRNILVVYVGQNAVNLDRVTDPLLWWHHSGTHVGATWRRRWSSGRRAS